MCYWITTINDYFVFLLCFFHRIKTINSLLLNKKGNLTNNDLNQRIFFPSSRLGIKLFLCILETSELGFTFRYSLVFCLWSAGRVFPPLCFLVHFYLLIYVCIYSFIYFYLSFLNLVLKRSGAERLPLRPVRFNNVNNL